MRKAVFIGIAIALPTVLLLVLAEIGLRWRERSILERQIGSRTEAWDASLQIHRASDTLTYEHIPGRRVVRDGVPIRINSAGFRDDEFPPEPEPDRFDIVVLGDSVAWGWGLSMEDAFPQVLESRLRERAGSGPPPVVYNLAVEGYSTDQELTLLERRGLERRPDLVIWSYVLNDPDVADGGLSRYFSRELVLWRYARRARLRLWSALSSEPEIDEYHHRIHAFYRERTRQQFRELGRIHREHGVPILVALTPVFDFEPGEPYRWQDLHDFIRELAQANGLELVDLYESFRDTASSEYSFDMWHPNARGHEIIAEALMERLTSGS